MIFVAYGNACRRLEQLARRDARQKEIDAGGMPDFLPETAAIREDVAWRGAAPGPGMADRRVEITVRHESLCRIAAQMISSS